MTTDSLQQLPMLASVSWQMSHGERAALEGILAQLRPQLAIEIGTAQGGSLARIAAYSDEVHSFDVVAPDPQLQHLDNVSFHTGDSHVLLPAFLEKLAAERRRADFVLVDGDHTAAGVRRDLEDLLASDAIQRTVVVLHDTMNEEVRSGIEQAGMLVAPKVRLVELDCVPGYLARREPYRLEMWGGLGLVLVESPQPGSLGKRDDRFYELFSLVRPARDAMRELERSGGPLDSLMAGEVEQRLRERLRLAGDPDLRAELARKDRLIHEIQGSLSWRLTAPLRAVKRSILRRAR